jgi:hypothetical protein
MFQEIEEFFESCEYNVNQELFYKYEDAVKYLEAIYDLYIDYIEKNYCEEGESADDVCRIVRYSENYYEIYMGSEFYTSFNIYEKSIMSFN